MAVDGKQKKIMEKGKGQGWKEENILSFPALFFLLFLAFATMHLSRGSTQTLFHAVCTRGKGLEEESQAYCPILPCSWS